VVVDAARTEIPANGTLVREDVHANRHLLSPVVYADFVKRVCLLGGESSGKTTLARALASEWHTAWVHEFGREYWVERGGVLTFNDLTHIGHEQCRREDTAAGGANRFLFCDTSPLTTLFYCQHDFGNASSELMALANRPYDLTLLCAPDIPFDQDGTRQPPEFRALQHAWYVRELAERGVRYTLIQGGVAERLASVRKLLCD
jgi:NadR type nicotinamide-nucleotide adenylyltransferase